jgi:hypothetical protein
MVQSTAAVIDAQQQSFLRRAVRIAFSDDDRDQQRILRIRVVWTQPRVGYTEFFGALLQDYGFDAEACRDVTLRGLQRLCTPRGGQQIKGFRGELDVDLWEAVRRKIFCGATDGAAVALHGVRLLGPSLPSLRYQFRDRPHTTRTCVKMAFTLCPESQDLRERLITGPNSFARRARASRRFREIWMRKQREDGSLFWNISQDLGYAEQRYDSRSRPMSSFCERLGPALQVLSEMARDELPAHRRDARWAKDLLQFLSGPAGFLKMVLFAIDTDFAVATHKLVRVQDAAQPDVSLAGHEVRDCLDVCRVLLHERRIFDRNANGTYTNRLLHGFAGVSQQVLLGQGGSVQFGWPNPEDDTGYLRPAVVHAEKLYKAVSLFFAYNFPDYAWRTRFEAFNLASPMSQTHRRGHVLKLAEKEGLNPAQTWQQFFEALPHAQRLYTRLGDARSAWATYLDDFCRDPKARRAGAWRVQARCIAELVLTYLGLMDGSSEVERNFSQLQLVECRRARRHHSEQVLQDLLKLRLHCPPEVIQWQPDGPGRHTQCKVADSFLRQAQVRYAEFFGCRRLATRSLMQVDLEVKRTFWDLRRPRWQHCGLKKFAERSRAARMRHWEAEVQRLVGERRMAKSAPDTFAPPVRMDLESLLADTAAALEAKGTQQRLAHEAAERDGLIAPPPAPVKAKNLLSRGIKRKALGARGLNTRRVAGKTAGQMVATAAVCSATVIRRKAPAQVATTPSAAGANTGEPAVALHPSTPAASSTVAASRKDGQTDETPSPRAEGVAVWEALAKPMKAPVWENLASAAVGEDVAKPVPAEPAQAPAESAGWSHWRFPPGTRVYMSEAAAAKQKRMAEHFRNMDLMVTDAREATHCFVTVHEDCSTIDLQTGRKLKGLVGGLSLWARSNRAAAAGTASA